MTYEEYKALRDQGMSHTDVQNRNNQQNKQNQQQSSSSSGMTYEDYKRLRDKGYSQQDIASGAYKQPKTTKLWEDTARSYEDWMSKQGQDMSKWDTTTASKYSRQFGRYAQDVNTYLQELTRSGKKAGDEDYDQAKGLLDFFRNKATALDQTNRDYKQYRDTSMYNAGNGTYLTYDEARKKEQELQDQLSGMKDEWVTDYSTFGGHRESNYDPADKKAKEEQLSAIQEWRAQQDETRDFSDWYQKNLADGQNSEYAFNAAGRRLAVTDNNVEILKKQMPQREFYATDEWGNLDATAEAKYNADYKAWNDKYTQALRDQARAQKEYSYAETMQFSTATEQASMTDATTQAIIAKGKAIAEGEKMEADQEYDFMMGILMPADITYAYMQQHDAKAKNRIQDTEGWSDEKKNTYYYLLGNGNDAAAERLAKITNEAFQKAKVYEEIYQPLEQFQTERPGLGALAATAAGTVIPLTMGLPEYLGMVEEYLATGEIDMNKPRLTQISQQMVGTTAGQINEWSGTTNESIPIVGGKGLGDVYQLGISILQSQLSMYTSMGMEGITLTQFFGSAASSGIMEGLEKGMDPGKALALGTLNGAAEAIGEVVSIDKLVQIKNSGTARSLLKDVFAQMGIEGSEEAFTTMMNTMADMLVNGDKNELQIAVQSYLSQGMSREDAEKQATKDWLNGLAFDFVGGAVSGGFGAGMATAAQNVGTYKGNVSYLSDLAQQTAEGSRSREMAEAIPENGRISAFRGNQFAATVQQDLLSNNTNTAVSAIEQRLQELGETGDLHQKATDIANAVISEMSGDEAGGWRMRASDQISANATANMRQIMQEISAAQEVGPDYGRNNDTWTDPIVKGRFLDESILQGDTIPSYIYDYERRQEKALASRNNQLADIDQQIKDAKKELGKISPTDSEGRRAINAKITELENKRQDLQQEALEDGYNDYRESDKTASVKVDGKQYTVQGLTNVDGDLKVELAADDGSTTTISTDDSRLPEAFRSLALKVRSLDWAAAQAFKYYKPGTNINDYIRRIQMIKGYAQERINHDAFMQTKTVQALNNGPLAEYLWGEGQRIYQNRQAKLQKKVEEISANIDKALDEKGTVNTKGKGRVDVTSGYTLPDGQKFNGIQGKKLSGRQQATVKMVQQLANALNIDYVLFDGDTHGINGAYRDGKIFLNINAGGKRVLVAETLSHELTHFIEDFAPNEYEDLRQFVVEELMKNNQGLYDRRIQNHMRYFDPNLSWDERYDKATREVVAEACTLMLKNSQTVTYLAQRNMSLAEKMVDFIDKAIENIKATINEAFGDSDPEYYRAEAKALINQFEKLQELWDTGLINAEAAYNARETAKARTSTEVGTYDIKEFAGAKDASGDDVFQVAAFEHDEPEYREMLLKTGMENEDINRLFETVDAAMDIIKGNLEALDYAWEADIDDRGFSPVKPNSDKLYKVSQDFSTLCRKRILQGAIANQLQVALDRALTREEGIAIRDALMAIQAEGKQIEVACALCYVESARMRSPKQIQRFLDNREKVLKDFFAGQDRATMKRKIAQAETDERNKIYQEGIETNGLDVRDPKAAPLKKLPGKVADRIRDAKKAVKATYVFTAEQQKIVDEAKAMNVSDFTTPEGLEALAKNHREIFDAYTSFIRNATNSKGIENDTWWRAGDSERISDLLIEQMNRENGLRTQSWSDFQVKHLMDYIAATIELSARGAKQHAYTKVPDYVDLMGETGVMINMSLIPTREYNGKLDYDNVEGFVAKEAKRLRDKYHATAGTICIGVKNEQIRQLLASDFIDYVIPYHRSGMAAHTRAAMHIPLWDDYQDFQGEKKLSGSAAKENASKYGVQLLSESDPLWHEAPAFSDWFDLERARQTAKLNGKTGKYGVMTGGYMAMQEAARNYMQICAERGLAPKFSYGRGDFSAEENYWKLLIDRKMVDNVTGDIIEQQKIKPIFDIDTIQRILDDELDRYGKVKADQNEATRRVTEAFLSGAIKGGMKSEEIAKAMQKPVDNISITNITQNADQYQRADQTESKEFKEWFGNSKIVDEDGKPLVVYHGTDAEFTVFDMTKGRSTMDIQGSFFSPWDIDAGGYGSNVGAYYLSIQNPAPEGVAYKALNRFKGQNNAGIKAREYLESLGYDGVNNSDEEYIAFYPEQIKSATDNVGTFDRSNPDIRYQMAEYAWGEGDLYNNRALVSEETIDKWLTGSWFGSNTNPDYAQAYIAYLTPTQYLRLTTIYDEYRVRQESDDRTMAWVKDISEGQPIQLKIDAAEGKVYDHEGRHRMVVLDRNGVKHIPVLLFDLDTKYSKEPMAEMKLEGQNFNGVRNYATTTIRDLVPLNTAHREEILDKFSKKTSFERISEEYDGYNTVQFQRAEGAEDTEYEAQERADAMNALQAENAILKETVEKLQKEAKRLGRELKRSKGPQETRLSDAKKLARSILKETGSSVNVNDIAGRIKEIADYVSETADALDYEHLHRRAVEIAREIVSNVNVPLDDGTGADDLRNEFKAALRSKRIYVPDMYKAETGDWNDFRKRYFGVMRFANNGTSIDQVYQDLLEEMPGVLDPDITNPGDMLLELASKWDAMQPEYGNPFDDYMNEAITSYANRIMQSALDGTLRQLAPTYADRMNDRIERLRAEKNDRIEQIRKEGLARKQEALARERAEKWERVEATRQYYQEMAERASIRRGNSQRRGQIRTLINDLNSRLNHPTEKKYVPANLVGTTVDILQMIDLDTGRGSERIQEKLALLQQQYGALKDDPSFAGYSYDPIIEEWIQNMGKTVGDTPLVKMNREQLDTVLQTLKALEHTIKTAVKVNIGEQERNAYEFAKGLVKETKDAKGVALNAFSKLSNKYVTNTMRPDIVFDYFAGFAKDSNWSLLAEMLNAAQEKGIDYQMQFAKIFEPLLADKKNVEKLTSTKDLLDIGLKDEDGDAILVTKDFALFTYMNLFNEENARHIMRGGMTVPELKEYLSGKGDRGYKVGSRHAVGIAEELSDIDHRIAEEEDVSKKAELMEERDRILESGQTYIEELRQNIEAKMTEYDHEWVKAWWKFNELATKILNDTTMEVYGIKKANVENYFPIITDKNFLNTPFESLVHDMTLENVGFMKERVGASNPIKMMGLADLINMQANRTAQYAAIMPAVRNFGKIYNKTMPGYTTSVQDTLSKKFGGDGMKFIENLMSDLQGGRQADFTIFDRLRGRMAQATLSLNPRVAMAQTASFPTAAAELGWKPVLKALARGGKKNLPISSADRELIEKWSSLLWYRSKGATVELGDVKQLQQAQHKVMDKMGWAMNWIEFMDSATVGRLWYAAQYYVDEHNPALQKGSDAYYEEVAKVFNRTVERTQPNYTTMQRPELLRNPNALYRQLAMFMTQRLQNQSIVYGATAKYLKYRSDLANGKNGVTEADVRQMRDRVAWAVSSQIVAAATITIFKFLSDALLHRLKAYRRDEDQELTAQSISLQMMNNFAESLVSNVFMGSEIYSAIKSMVTKERYYGIELSGVSTFTDLIENVVKMGQKPSWATAKKLGEAVAQFYGVPAENAEKIGMAVWYHMKDAMNGEFLSYESDVDRTNAQNARMLTQAYVTGNKKDIEKYRASFKDEDTMMNSFLDYIKSQYVVKEGQAQTISKEQATDLLVQAGMYKKDAAAKVQEWTCELVTGIPYSKIKDEYMAGNITAARVSELLQTYGGRDKESADKTARQYGCEKETGIPYNDLKDAYMDGAISKSQLTQALRKYGPMSQNEANNKALYYDFQMENPDADISQERAISYMTTVKPTGVTGKQYVDALENMDADTNGSFSQAEVGGYLANHSFTKPQRDALWTAFGNNWKTDFDTWQVKVNADLAGTGKGAGNGNVSQDELGTYLVQEINAGRMTMEEADRYWSALLTTSKKDFSAWLKKKRYRIG